MNENKIQTKASFPIPKETCFDDTIKLLSEGYLYIPNRMKKYNTDIFQTRLIGKKVVCLSGKEAAEIFYNQTYFTRKGVIPNRILETLFGKKGVQTLDGAAHMHRKN
jgi:fatty-acid peroxygenase